MTRMLPTWLTDPRPRQTPLAVLLIAASLVTGLHYAADGLERYRPGADESYMLQAAVRLHAGHGFTSIWPDAGVADLSEPTYRPMSNWPPMWPLLMWALLSATGDADSAATGLTLVKVAASLLGCLGWLRLASRLLPGPAVLMFALGLAGLLYGNTPFGNAVFVGPSHLLTWAVLPWWLAAMLTGLAADGRARDLLWAGALAALMVGLRYSALFLAPAGAAAVLLLWPVAGTVGWRPRLARAAACSAPPVLMLVGLAALNAAWHGRALWILSDARPGWYWENLAHGHLLSAWFAFGFGVEEAVFKFSPRLRAASPTALSAVFASWYALLTAAAVISLLRRWTEPRLGLSAEQVRALALAALALAAMLALLSAAAVRTGPDQGFNPLAEQRYFGELLPAVALAWLVVLSVGLRPEPEAELAPSLSAPFPSAGKPGMRTAMPQSHTRPDPIPTFPADGEGASQPPAPATLKLTWRHTPMVLAVAAILVSEGLFVFFAARVSVRRVRTALREGPRSTGELERELRRLTDAPAAAGTLGTPDAHGRPHRVLDWFEGGLPMLVWRDEIRIRDLLDDEALARTGNARPTWTLVVVRWEWDAAAGRGKPWRDPATRRAWQNARFLLGPTPREVGRCFDGGQLCVVYGGVVEPFAPGRRPVPSAEELPEPPGQRP